MSTSKNNRTKARRELRRQKEIEDLKLKKTGDEFREMQINELEAEKNLDSAIRKPKRFPAGIYNKPKKENKGLVDKFKRLLKLKI